MRKGGAQEHPLSGLGLSKSSEEEGVWGYFKACGKEKLKKPG